MINQHLATDLFFRRKTIIHTIYNCTYVDIRRNCIIFGCRILYWKCPGAFRPRIRQHRAEYSCPNCVVQRGKWPRHMQVDTYIRTRQYIIIPIQRK